MSLESMKRIAKSAKEASYALPRLSNDERNAVLESMAKRLIQNTPKILKANQKDIQNAQKAKLAPALVGRLKLDETKLKKVAAGLIEIAKLPDPLGRLLESVKRPNGLIIQKVSVPIGVILIIYESRPNVTADCAGLCLKSGNSVILRGGKEAFESNQAIHQALVGALKEYKVPSGAVSFVASKEHRDVDHLLGLRESIDLVIPRGGESLIRRVSDISKIPVLRHYQGICHTYIDREAELSMALSIAENAKVQNPGVCNAMETLLVDRNIAKDFLIPFAKKMKATGVELRGCPRTRKIVKGIKAASEKDWRTEYLDLVLSVRVVDDVTEAIGHIRQYGSGHSDAIVSDNAQTRKRFLDEVDSACVFENASTRFSDGGEFGMGAEMGISTDKLHARGPVGIRELTSYKYVITGRGHVRT